jgi:8-oxo-dGTP diphosphatase
VTHVGSPSLRVLSRLSSLVTMATYRNPTPTVDCIVELPGERIVLIRRKNPPLGWALPGGFVDVGEPLHVAAVREVKEETGLSVDLSEQFFTYSDPTRDPRQHTLSTVYIGWAEGEPSGSDDAEEAKAFSLDELPRPLCFDHGTIVADYIAYKRTGKRRKI